MESIAGTMDLTLLDYPAGNPEYVQCAPADTFFLVFEAGSLINSGKTILGHSDCLANFLAERPSGTQA